MDSRDLVTRAAEFRNPPRLPFAKGDHADIAYVNFARPRHFLPSTPGLDEWGCLWTSLNPGSLDQGQVSRHPLDNWSSFERYSFPDPNAPGRFDHLPAQVALFRSQRRFICASLGKGPMHLLDDLRSFENYLADLLLNPERIDSLLDGIFLFLAGLLDRFADLGVDAVLLYDDQAVQSGPLFDMQLWRRHFAPRYRRLFDRAHHLGLKVYMHTCGNLSHHLEPLVAVGVDIIDNKQPALWMDSPAVDAVRGKVAFSSCLDIQTTIHTIPSDQIPAEVDRLVRRLSLPSGGFIATYYHQPDLLIPPERTRLMLDAFRSFRWTR